jgi:putative transposase
VVIVMAPFLRYYIPNALVFITSVTRDRLPLFAAEHNVDLLFSTLRSVQAIHPFHLLAYAILPDHMHLLMRTEPDTDFSQVMKSIKWNFTRNYKAAKAIEEPLPLWQERFWDHVIRDETDLSHHMDYIHYNPVKHGCVDAPEKWKSSTFSYWLERGYYTSGWGRAEPSEIASFSWE